jgi:hypothetical protein
MSPVDVVTRIVEGEAVAGIAWVRMATVTSSATTAPVKVRDHARFFNARGTSASVNRRNELPSFRIVRGIPPEARKARLTATMLHPVARINRSGSRISQSEPRSPSVSNPKVIPARLNTPVNVAMFPSHETAACLVEASDSNRSFWASSFHAWRSRAVIRVL